MQVECFQLQQASSIFGQVFADDKNYLTINGKKENLPYSSSQCLSKRNLIFLSSILKLAIYIIKSK